MKKISEWFRNQTFTTKVVLVVLSVLLFVGVLGTIGSYINKATTPPVPVETNEPLEPTPTPTGTAVPVDPTEPVDPRKDELNEEHEGGENEDNVAPNANSAWTTADLDNVSSFLANAVTNYCDININETDEARRARLSQWFAPQSQPMQPNQIIPFIQVQQCNSLGSTYGLTDPDTGDLNTTTTVNLYTAIVATDGAKPTVQQIIQKYDFKINKIDGKWMVTRTDD
jgi:hypothetical protein